MPAFRPTLLRAQRGFSLSELMIAATIGLLILAGMTTLFVNNSRAQAEIEKANRQIENGRFAMQALTADLRNAGFYGEFDPTVLASPADLPDPCALTVAALKGALPLPVQGIDDADADALDCLPGLVAGTDVIVVRRTATCIAGTAGCAPVSDGGPFFQASLCTAAAELGSGDTADFYGLDIVTTTLDRHQRNCTTAAAIRRYLTHVYYISANDREADGVPTLKRAELGVTGTALSITEVPLVNGIENLQVEYGLDTGADGVADLFTASPATAASCADAACAVANWRNVVSVKLNLLARNLEPTAGFTDDKRYKLGLDAAGEEVVYDPENDAYKRHVFQSLVALPNPAGRKTP
ncbi:prepilin-type N-terminal cleavage/methylation domain-containing protein [Massilia sp. RP-1-19]|uniref:Prepilin-type N-terminal cleavage/methylation domain-containing protein n=1 Tax=Massilia polaris TaxID=2728846 RepID=A0A848HF28_9BURK|nr:PilW family protein [Massilia polaris]NML60045.1 prepilin-type N-terminal cleavage/methylation domain-containing protein [Massilia polaris]